VATTTRYLQDTMRTPPLLLRSVRTATELGEDAWIAGAWQPTKVLLDYRAGHNDDVEPITDAAARELEPQAFAGPLLD
jgi:hypothetical protein